MAPIVALMVLAIASASSASAQPNPLTVADVIALARPITNGDSQLQSVEIRGSCRFGVPFRFSYWYEAPDTYEGLSAVDDPKATYFAAVRDRAIFYDPRRGQLLEFTDVVPGIQAIIQNDDLRIAYSFSKRTVPSTQPPPQGVIIDMPAIVRDRRLTKQDLQPLPGGKYRLVLADQTGYYSVAATIDPSQDIAYADIEISVNQRTFFVEMHINRAPPASLPRVANVPELRASIEVEETAMPSGIAAFSTLAALQFLTPAVIVPSQRQGVENALGEKPNWAELEANLRRDIPKLQQALPLP